MFNLNEIFKNGCFCFSCAGLRMSQTTSTKVEMQNDIHYLINEQACFKAAVEISLSTAPTQAENTSAMYFFAVTPPTTPNGTNGTVFLIKKTEDKPTGSNQPMIYENLPDNRALIGAMRIDTAGVVFNGNATDLNAEGITATFYNLNTLPSKPFLA